ncbi:MAG: YigZ family protein [Bacteroidales bacterium]|nr:YigZ family protein [Bacteroidales bacterium]
MFDDTYLTIEEKSQGLYKEKGSKFISFAFPVRDMEEIKDIIKDIKKEYFDARHHCYAYILGQDKSIFRMNDDGEPSSTGGKPIYGQLLSKDLTNVLVVVIRYFGGVKLGVGGLIQAYKLAALDALDNAMIIERTVDEVYGISFNYSLMNDVMRVMKENDLKQINHRFEIDCYMEFVIRKSFSIKVIDSLSKIEGIGIVFLRVE